MGGRNSPLRKDLHLCQGISSLAVRQELQDGRDYNPVLNVRDTWRRPRGLLRRFFLRIGTYRPPQDDLVPLYFNRDTLGICLRIADERLPDVLLQVTWQRMRPDCDEIGDAFDSCQALYDTFGISLLKAEFDLAPECDPALADRHIQFASRNSGIPPEGIEDSFGQVGVGAFGRAGQSHLDVVGNRLDATHAVCGILRRQLFQIRIDPASQHDNTILDCYTDFVDLHMRIPLQFIQDVSLDIFISTDANRHGVCLLSLLCRLMQFLSGSC